MAKSQEETPASASGGLGRLFLGIVLGSSLTLGSGAATYLWIGPSIVRARIDGVVAEAVGQALECAVAGAETEIQRGSAVSKVHEIPSLVANPSGGGFLMLSLGVEVESDEHIAQLQARDLQIRDAVLRHLATKSSSSLLAEGARERLSAEIRDLIAQEAPSVTVNRVLFPQFVIQ